VRINPTLSEWLNLAARWFHVFAGILWIGTTYYFTWLDGQLSAAERDARDGEPAEVWMVHSGGFYVVGKRKTPGTRPLHWFRWEAALTWLSGMALLVVVYYLGGAMLDPDVSDITNTTAVLISLGALAFAWIAYDLLASTPLVRNDLAFAAVCFALVTAASYGLTRVFSGRAAYLHVGAMFGTIMAANVWMRILPAQRRTIAAAKSGETFDPALGLRAKQRSKHNTFMAVPVVFTMISNHFPVSTYGSRYNWLVLSALVLAGWVAAKFVRRG
jgi:uncharacterized membrane protein